MIITLRLDYKINMSESENKITKKDKKSNRSFRTYFFKHSSKHP